MGNLAIEKFQDEQNLSGILIKRGFSYHIVDPSDVSGKIKQISYTLESYYVSKARCTAR